MEGRRKLRMVRKAMRDHMPSVATVKMRTVAEERKLGLWLTAEQALVMASMLRRYRTAFDLPTKQRAVLDAFLERCEELKR